jgi:NAD(P)-dependent dehydrogenase (short-subunit alcohol dehydrogenase family)
MNENTQKIAIVTGAGSGIGQATAVALVKAGYHVVLAGRRREKLAETAVLANKNTLIVETDITKPEDIHALFAQTQATYGRLDLLFNNAGIGAPAVPLEEIPFDRWQAVVNTNLTGPFLCTQAAFKQMKQQTPMGGRIINNGSISAHTPRPNSAPYTATKHAITGLTKSTNLDGRPFNIVCSQIDIGNAATPMTKRMPQGVPQADGSLKPEPTMDVHLVAEAIVHMASLPLEANIPFMTIMANMMPFIGRG